MFDLNRLYEWTLVNEESFRGVVDNVLDSNIVVSQLEPQSRDYFSFRTNALGKGMNTFISPSIG